MPRKRPHLTTYNDMTAGARNCIDARKAATPWPTEMSPMPIAWRRALTPPPAAMPTSAHGPH
eukprot:scaffold36275_cov154-Isochrysis_galbana.AAC.12